MKKIITYPVYAIIWATAVSAYTVSGIVSGLALGVVEVTDKALGIKRAS